MSRLRSPLLAVAVLTFLNAAAWGLITPTFEGPDEDAHVSYADYFAQTGKTPRDQDDPYASSELQLAIAVTGHFSVFRDPLDTRPPWLARDQRRYDDLVAELHPSREDGGGPTGASNYGPAYYAVAGAADRVVGGSVFGRIYAMRLVSALLAAIAVGFVFATVRELFPRHPWAPVAAGLMVAFQPMFGFISGVVNADAAANAAGAALLYLAIRALRRGLTARIGVAAALVFVVGTVAKTTVVTLTPALLLALVLAARRRRPAPAAWGALVGSGAALGALWAVAASALGRPLVPSVSSQASLPDSLGRGHHPPLSIVDRLAYLWEVFLPPLPSMTDVYSGSGVPAWTIYVKRAWGSFGWLSIDAPRKAFYVVALLLVVVGVLGIRAALRERPAVRARAAELAVLVVALVSVALSIHLSLARHHSAPFILEQGRYLFPAITAAVVLAIGACFGLGRRLAPLGATALATGMMVAGVLAQLFVFTKYFT